MEIAIAIAAKVIEYTVAPIGRQLGHLIFYKRNVKNLKIQIQRLEETKDRIQRDVDAAKRNGQAIHTDVQNSLNKVNELIGEASKLFGDEGRAMMGCYSTGSCPNVLSNHQISKKSNKLLLEVTTIQLNGNLSSVSYKIPPPSLTVTLVTKDCKALDSRTKISTEIMEKLKDSTIQTIGVWGLAGVGKTTLVKQVARLADGSKLFGKVIMATATVSPDVRRIQGELADALGSRFDEETEVGRANRLCQRISQENNILIIIDDIWGGFELERIGVMLGEGHKGSKLLLTSRSHDVLKREMGIQVGFRLEVLQEKEAWTLFEEMAGDTAKDLNVQPIAIEVVKRCAGLPVLIATVAKALKDAALYIWKDSLKQLERFDKEGMHAKVYSALELSYNHLKGQEIKSLFLLIALHGQRSVSKHDLLIISMGLGLFKYVDTLEDARNRLNKLTNDLEESCLLIKDEREIENVKIHDLVRYAGSSIAAKDQLFRIDIEFESKEWPRKDILGKYRGLLLSVRHQSDLPQRLECPQLKLFALKCQEDHLKISDSFFEVMREVKVLCFYEMKLISSPPLVLHGLNCLRALYLYECTLEDISIVGELTNLEILSVRQSDLKQLPSEIGRLHRLKMLDLMYCKSLKVITPRVISNLIGLEELNMEGSFINWEVEAGCNSKSYNASLGELKELPNLRSLCIRIPDARTLSTDIFLFFGKLQRFKIEIGQRTSWPSIYKFSQILTIKSSGSCIIQSENWIPILPEKVEYLKLDRVNGVKNVFLDMNAKGFSQLKVLKVSNDAETECLINFISSKNPRHVLQSLEKLVLKHWNNLVHICRGPITEESFCKLRIVRVYGCQKLKSLFSFSMSRIISQLVEIQVSNCVSMEEIVSLGREMENHDPGLSDIEFAELRYLKIMGLPALISFCSMRRISSVSQGLSHKLPINTEIEKMDATGKYENSLPFSSDKEIMLETSAIERMDKLRTVLEHQITPNSFSKVKLIEISDCAKLVTIFPSHLVRNFQNLETLKVKNCNSVEEIFDHRELQDEKTHANVGGISCHLRYLNLQGLPKLKYIWSGDPKGVFKLVQDLQSVEVEECKNLNYIFSAPVAKCLLQLEKLEIISCGVTKIVSEDEASSGVVRFHFPQLKHIKLKSLPKIKSFYPEVMFTLECSMLKELDIDVFDICNEILLSPVEKVIVPKLESLCLGAKTTTILYLNDQFQDLFRTLKILRVCDCSSLRSLVHTSYSSTLFRNLHTLEIESCDGLINLVTFSTLKSTLVRLQNLSIRNCEKIEEIISSTGHQVQHVEDDEIAFNQLESLKLFCLPNLKCFSREKCTLKFPSLKEVIVVACPKLEVFSSGILVAPLLCGVIQNKYLEGEKRWEGDLSNTVKGMFIDMQEEMAKGFPNIIKHPLHKKHELLLARGTHGCDGCGEYRDGWSYFCGRCEFDLDPGCALEDSNKTTNESGNEQVEESNIRR